MTDIGSATTGIISRLKVQLFADCASLDRIACYSESPMISGITTNPALMKAAGVTDYRKFVTQVAELAGPRSISFAAFGRTQPELSAHVREIHNWCHYAYIKVPAITADGESCAQLIANLAADGIPVNVTTVFTGRHAGCVLDRLGDHAGVILSVFAGRIADSGRNPVTAVGAITNLAKDRPNVRVLWASSRELYNIVQADEAGADIITLGPELLDRMSSLGRELESFAVATVEEFCAAADVIKLQVRAGT
jgi:transaldolase